ncbi:homeobox protein cut isoform X2 [Plodia interpunctella]|uniref:homeobox protein cut isoform X2 n=1 Tax=Plodia interpunctella TaxID=58824 RepID=UPI002368DEC5|nr:homeobox protein cut isoform X2 [Plodia interpunctella]
MHPTGAASLPAAPEAEVQAMHSMDWLFKKERIYLLAQFWQQRATLAEKEVTTLKEQLATTSPTPLQATVPPKTNGSHIDQTRDQATETRIPDLFSPDIKEEKRLEIDEEVEKMEMAATGRGSDSTRSSPVGQANPLENELAAKEKEIAQLVDEVRRLQASLNALQEAHAQKLQRLEERLDEKKKHIARLEARLDNQRDYDDIKREISMLRSLDLGSGERSLERKPEPLRSPPAPAQERRSTEREQSAERRDTGPEEWPSTPPPLNNNTTHHNNNGPTPLPLPPPSPFRFEEHRPYRFAEDMGPLPPGALVGRLGDSLIPKGDPMEARLQEMLRYNMDKYANTNLDTLHISRRVRELLSVHNIGQRLFAKYVLGLSQGTVSELLSKPKPWDKLTEKGRDSYRKMHAWACDEAAVMLLKSLIPKKVGTKDGTLGPGFGRPDSEGDERLAHILNEASHLMKPSQPNNDDSRSNEDSSSPRTQCPSPYSKDSSQNRRLKKYENDDIPQEKVVRIYQEELAKIMTRRVEDMRHSRDGFPGGGMPPHMERPPEDIRMALEAYHRELAKIQPGGNLPNLQHLPGMPPFPNLLALQQQAMQQAQNQHMNGSGAVQDLSLPKDKNAKMNGMTDSDKDRPIDAEEAIRHAGSAFSLVRPKLEPGQQSTGSSASSPLGNAILPPAITPNDDFSSSAAASPLQRMASITNSLISQPTNPPHHAPPQRSMKAVLPPITQQQFDLFNNLNTEDIVRRVKEALSQYSISQRLFGESVLGLSQGSVSDLLARPKPWHMLTQKGREPFIRMKMFLEDDNAVHKLVASQYKIAPEKLMRTGNYSGAPPCPPNMSKPMPPAQKMLSDASSLLSKMQQEQLLGAPHLAHLAPAPLLLTPPGFPPHHAVTLPSQHHDNNNKERKPPPPTPPHQHQVMRNLHQHMSPSVYEMAALTQDLDTQTITTKIKEALLANNIGQKIFGEAVLGLSQGSVSELLSKPKPWHMLSIKGREPFIRMQLWLSDAHNIDRLQALKNERREANKRRRSSGPGQDNSSDTSSNDTSEFYHSSSPGPTSGVPSAKKQRVLFSEEQKEALRLAFALDPYPNMPTIEFLAGELGLSTRTITNWFHNHRMRLKQQAPHGLPAEPPARDQSTAPFEPVQFRLLLNQRLLELQKERMGLAGVPLPYPPYFAANTNLAALIGRGLVPPDERGKDQSGGLDLSMPLKREPDGDDFEDDDVESNLGSEDSLDDGESKTEPKAASTPAGGRSNRRKPAAPQWVNPDWQDEKPRNPDEVIINGVCVMRSDDYRREAEETVRVEPAAVARDGSPAATPPPHTPLTPHTPHTPHTPRASHTPEDVLPEDKIKTETEDDRWEY